MQLVQGCHLQPQEVFQDEAKIEGKSQTPLKAILAILVSHTLDVLRLIETGRDREAGH